MHKSKLLALLLAVAMVVSMVVVPAYAADEYTIKLADANGNTNVTVSSDAETVDLYLYLENNPGFLSAGAMIDIPDGWTLASKADTSPAGTTLEGATLLDASHTNLTKDPYKVSIIVNNSDGSLAPAKDGAIAKLTFNLPAEPSADPYTFAVDLTSDTSLNANSSDPSTGVLTPAAVNCTVTVAEPAEPSECPECKEKVIWTEVAENAWAAGGAIPTTATHYKLMGNQNIAAALTVAADQKVCIDLNGKNITAAGTTSKSCRVFSNAGTLTILDTTAATAEGVYTSGVISGGFFTAPSTDDKIAKGGNIYNEGTLNLYSGTISGGTVRQANYGRQAHGGNVYNAGTFNMYGGVIENGLMYASSYTSAAADAIKGGNLYNAGTAAIKGGIIRGGGTYKDGVNQTKSTSTGSTNRYMNVFGGNIASVGGSLSIENATISGGKIAAVYTYLSVLNNRTVQSICRGGNIYIQNANGEVVIKDSVIEGGEAAASFIGGPEGKRYSYSFGGNIYTEGSTVTLSGNTQVTGGTLNPSLTIQLAEGETLSTDSVKTCRARGGSIYMENGTLNLKDSTSVTGGTANKADGFSTCGRGGNIYASGNVNVYDNALVSGGTAAYGGDNVMLTNQSSNLNVYGGQITHTDAVENVYLMYANANVYGGVIKNTESGNALYAGNSDANVSTVKVFDGTISKLYVSAGSTADAFGGTINALSVKDDTSVVNLYNVVTGFDPTAYTASCATAYVGEKLFYVYHAVGTCETCAHTFANAATTVCETCSVAHVANACAHSYDESLVCTLCGAAAPVCSHCDQAVAWELWDGNTAMTDEGHYYLPCDIKLTKQFSVVGTSAANTAKEYGSMDVCLDLNGFTLTAADGKSAFRSYYYADMAVMDTSAAGTGKVQGSGVAASNAGGVFNFSSESKLSLYNVEVTGGIVADTYAGGNIKIEADLYIENSQITNGKILNIGEKKGGDGGNISASSSYITIVGAESVISGGDVNDTYNAYGGNIYLTGGGTLDIQDGVISGGIADDGASIYCMNTDTEHGTVKISGGTIEADAKHDVIISGSADYVTDMTMTGGHIDMFHDGGAYNTIQISGGTLGMDPSAYLVDAVVLHDASEEIWKVVADFATAYGAAEAGDTISLGEDAEADEVSLNGITLNLNGHSLTATSLDSSANGNVIDSTNGKGKVVSDDVMFHGDNTMVPVTTGDGTAFEKADITEKWHPEYKYEEGASTAKYVFYINPLKADTAMDDAMGDETLLLSVHVKWTYQGVEKEQYFDLDPAEMAEFVEKWDTSALILTLNNLEDVTNLSVDAVIISNDVTAGANE